MKVKAKLSSTMSPLHPSTLQFTYQQLVSDALTGPACKSLDLRGTLDTASICNIQLISIESETTLRACASLISCMAVLISIADDRFRTNNSHLSSI